MIPVRRPRAPKTFNALCRDEGKKWLKANPIQSAKDLKLTKEPKDFWSQFEPELRAAFQNRCGWLAMWLARSGRSLSQQAPPQPRPPQEATTARL